MTTSTIFVPAAEQARPAAAGRSGCMDPRISRACARPGALTAEALDLIGPLVKPGRDDREPRPVRVRVRPRPRRLPGAAQLSRLPQVDLHLDQPRRLPRHAGRQALARRRHPQHRRDPDRRRLARRREPDVRRRRAAAAGAAPDGRHLRGADARHRRDQARRDHRRHRLRHPDLRRGRALLGGARFLRPRPRPAVPRRAEHPACRAQGRGRAAASPACSSPSSR